MTGPGDGPIEIAFELDEAYLEDWRALQNAYAWSARDMRLARWIFYGGSAVAGFTAAGLALWAGLVEARQGGVIAALAALIYYCAVHIGWSLAVREARIMTDAVERETLPFEPVSARLDDAGLSYRQRSGSYFWDWRFLTAVERDARGLVLMRRKTPVALLPRRAFAGPDACAAAAEFVTARIAQASAER